LFGSFFSNSVDITEIKKTDDKKRGEVDHFSSDYFTHLFLF